MREMLARASRRPINCASAWRSAAAASMPSARKSSSSSSAVSERGRVRSRRRAIRAGAEVDGGFAQRGPSFVTFDWARAAMVRSSLVMAWISRVRLRSTVRPLARALRFRRRGGRVPCPSSSSAQRDRHWRRGSSLRRRRCPVPSSAIVFGRNATARRSFLRQGSSGARGSRRRARRRASCVVDSWPAPLGGLAAPGEQAVFGQAHREVADFVADGFELALQSRWPW